MEPQQSAVDLPRRSQRKTKGVIVERFRDDEAASEVSNSSVLTSSSRSSLKHRKAKLDVQLKLARLEEDFERKQLERRKKIIELELAAQRAAIDHSDEESPGLSGSGVSFKKCASIEQEKGENEHDEWSVEDVLHGLELHAEESDSDRQSLSPTV